MARIDSSRFIPDDSDNSSRMRTGNSVRARYRFLEKDGEKFYQIKTFGSDDREYADQASQSIEIDRDVAIKIVNDLTKFFNITESIIDDDPIRIGIFRSNSSNQYTPNTNPEIVRQRLETWKNKPSGAYFRIIKSFFASCADRGRDSADLEWMQNTCEDTYNTEYYTDHFNYFHQYMKRENTQTGRIFKEAQGIVALCDDVKDIVLEYKCYFYQD